MIQRRAFVAGMAAVMAAPRVGTAQVPAKNWRIAWLGEGSDPGVPNASERAFIDGLRDLGYIESKQFTMTRRFAGGSRERLRELAEELAQLKPDLIAAPGTQALLALKAATTTIPVVMIYPGDPVGAGIVNNLNRPGFLKPARNESNFLKKCCQDCVAS